MSNFGYFSNLRPQKTAYFAISTLQNSSFLHFFTKKFGKTRKFDVSLHRETKTRQIPLLRSCDDLRTALQRAPNNHHTPSTTEFLPNSALNIQPPHHGQMIFEILLTFGFVHRLHSVTRSLQLGNQTILTAQIDGIQADKRLALSQIRLQPPHPSSVAVTIDLMVRK